MRTKKKSKHQVSVEAWCLDHEITPEMLDDQYVDEAKTLYQNVARLLPEKKWFKASNQKNFGEWAWRSIVIDHFIGQKENFTLYLLLMLHKKSDYFTYSNLASKLNWQTLQADIRNEGQKLLDHYIGLVNLHLRDVQNTESTIYDFPKHATYLESFLATRLYIDSGATEDLELVVEIDEQGVFDNYAALVSSVYLLNLYCNSNQKGGGEVDERIIESCARATSYLLRKQPEPYTKSFRQIAPLCF